MIDMIEPEQTLGQRIHHILMESDLSAAAFLLGLTMIAWGLAAMFKAPEDFFAFRESMPVGSTWFWFANYTLGGLCYMVVAVRSFPPTGTMLLGAYSSLVWTWIAIQRTSANFSSGVTLNFVVIVMGFLVAQRAQVRK